MSVVNVVDSRSDPTVAACDAVFEIVYVEGVFAGSPPINPTTKKKPKDNDHFTEWMTETSVYSALAWAMERKAHITVHFYDQKQVAVDTKLLSLLHPRIKERPVLRPYWL